MNIVRQLHGLFEGRSKVIRRSFEGPSSLFKQSSNSFPITNV